MQSHMSTPLQIARRYWGMSLVRGVIAIIFGLLAIFWPHLTFALFMRAFGIFAIVEGIILIGSAFTQRTVRAPSTTDYTRQADTSAQAQYTRRGEEVNRERFAYGPQNQAPAYGSEPQTRRDQTTGYTAYRGHRSTLMLEGLLTIICGILALLLPGVIGTLALYAVAAWAAFKGIGSLVQSGTRGWVLGVIGVLGIILALLIVFFKPLAVIHSLLWIVGAFSLIMGIMLVLRGLRHNTSARETRPIEPSY
jgi:uncharacterized membrane protein HdeD (DUF308 family)